MFFFFLYLHFHQFNLYRIEQQPQTKTLIEHLIGAISPWVLSPWLDCTVTMVTCRWKYHEFFVGLQGNTSLHILCLWVAAVNMTVLHHLWPCRNTATSDCHAMIASNIINYNAGKINNNLPTLNTYRLLNYFDMILIPLIDLDHFVRV